MSAPHLHPEPLIDALLRGEASAAQRAELEAHVRVCATCAAEQRLRAALGAAPAFLGVSAPGTSATAPAQVKAHDDRQAVDRVLERLGAEGRFIRSEPTLSAATTAAASSGAWSPWLLALCVFFSGSAAAAALIAALRPAPPPAVQEAVAQPARAPVQPSSEVAAQTREPQPVPGPLLPVHSSADALGRKASRSRERALPKGAVVRAAADEPSAAELFAEARAAQLAHRAQAAVALYDKLERRYPSSTEAHVSHVMLGRLYLEELDAPRIALGHFDRYLATPGPNQPEALIGRARCLRALGRGAEEIQTLRKLIERYPDSFYVEPARARMRDAE